MFARPRDLAYLRREVVTLQRAGGLRRETMQGVESRPDALQAPSHAAVWATQVFGERRAGQSWVEHDPVFSDVGQWPYRRHALPVLRQPFFSPRCPVEHARSVFAGVKLGEHRFGPRRVHGVIAQDVALARTVADRGDDVPVGARLIRSSIGRRVRGREHVVHVP